MDYTIYCAELQSVDLTAAPTADSFQQEVDATDASKVALCVLVDRLREFRRHGVGVRKGLGPVAVAVGFANPLAAIVGSQAHQARCARPIRTVSRRIAERWRRPV